MNPKSAILRYWCLFNQNKFTISDRGDVNSRRLDSIDPQNKIRSVYSSVIILSLHKVLYTL